MNPPADAPLFLEPSAFTERLIRWNGLDAAGFSAWEFLPGMRFGERQAWWRGGGDRGGPHEGLDICRYRCVDGRRLSLGAGARIPAIYPGVVAALVEDFLGVSLFVAHERHDGGGRRLYTVYGHLAARAGLAAGIAVDDGDAVGTIADPGVKNRAVPPHLHLTLALIGGQGPAAPLDWGSLRDPNLAQLLDPQPVIGCAP